ncbi:thrombospondin type 3 repeat-containing protein [uncultured Croceitalea sp.]|uniref:thrombospondin type 3 repeat-containing protein n=1 Tax=uncultured Croceitalea sp. TaxID=1798908 RepID=UPI00330686AB
MKRVFMICLLLFGSWAAAQNISAIEYFIDIQDPGVGNGIPLAVNGNAQNLTQSFAIQTTGLVDGFHSLYVRSQTSTGNWSLYDRTVFYITSISDLTQSINAAEFFFDQDPGIGNGMALALNSNNGDLTQSFTIPTTTLSEGFHSLYVRTRNNDGNWSLYDRTIVYIGAFTDTDQPITAAEYFFDVADPGVGNATSLSLDQNNGEITQSFALTTTGLTAGNHTIYIRVRTESGLWSLYDSASFTIDSTAIDNTVTVNENVLTANFNTTGASYKWLSCGTNVPLDATGRSFTATFSGSYAVEITFNGQKVVSSCIDVTVINPNDNDNDGVDNDMDNCPDKFNPDQVDSDNDGEGDVCDNDMDNDGVLDTIDVCPNTPEGSIVDFDGCPTFSLPPSNFTLKSTGESCIENDDGSLLLSASIALNYTATLSFNGASQTSSFTQEVGYTDLEAGDYQICITVSGQSDYEQCFSVFIPEPEPLSVSSKINPTDKSITLDLKGSQTYFIELNGENFRTNEQQITLPLTKIENTLNVTGDKGCQGSYQDILVLSDHVVAYPNPVVQESMSVYLGSRDEFKTIKASVFTISGTQVLEVPLPVKDGFINIKTAHLSKGVYILKLYNKTTLFNHKIVKQ